jgi:predicted unusual protein kinase regulating ubiquinone biosynthesis (AarF/ABC1/UbiB family)
VSRRVDRLTAFLGARLKRAGAAAREALFGDADVTTDRRRANLAEAEAFAGSATELGAVVAKVAQVRAYLDGSGAAETPEARALLARLWDKMPARDISVVRQVFVDELGKPPEQLFARFDEQPIAAASLGQVHAAEDSDGRRFAVKVQYPGVGDALRDDLRSPALLRRLLGAELGEGAADEAVQVIAKQLLGELDYRAEAGELEIFARMHADDPAIVIPRIDSARSTGRILTMERLDGRPLAEVVDEDERNKVAATIFRFAFGGVLRFGRFNADPHPGNYLALSDGRVGFVDFGSAAQLDDETWQADRKLFLALIHREGEELRHATHLEGLVGDASVFEGSIWREWEQAFGDRFLTRESSTLRPRDAARLLKLAGDLVRTRRMSLAPNVVLLWRQRLGALVVIASLGATLPFRRLVAEMLDDGRNPIPLYDRWL